MILLARFRIYKNPQNLAIVLVVALLTLGIFFRIVNLDKKIFWHDEVYTKLYMSGHPRQDWTTALFNGSIIEVKDLQKYVSFNPQTTLNDTLQTLVAENPHYPPLYHIIARFWVQSFGDSIAVIRSLSVVASLLIFPALYWLCWELFKSPIIGGTALAIMAVSPFFVLYAQEARDYTLWTVFILLTSGALLRAIRLENKSNHFQKKNNYFWGIYGILTALSLYTSLLTVPVITALVIYLILIEKFRLTRIVIFSGIALLGAIVAFLPWLLILIANYPVFSESISWTSRFKIPLLDLVKYFSLNLSRVFFDFGWEFEQALTYLVVLLALVLVGYSFYWLCSTTSRRIRYFILSLTVVPASFFLVPDLLEGGVRSIVARYLMPTFLGFILAVSYLLATKVVQPIICQVPLPRIWPVLAVFLLSASIASCVINSQKQAVWTQGISYSIPQVAQAVNQSTFPLLVGNQISYNPGNIFALSYLLKPKVKLQLLSPEKDYTTYTIPKGFSDVFFLNPPDNLREKLEEEPGIKIEWVLGDLHLWLWKAKMLDKQ